LYALRYSLYAEDTPGAGKISARTAEAGY